MTQSRFAAVVERLHAVERSSAFQAAVIAVIVLSALTVGAKTYALPPVAEATLGVLDLSITVLFLFEILLRFSVCPRKSRFLLDGWNLFDTIIVVGSLLPLDNADAVLLGRLLRVFRVLRLVSVVPQLRFLINALIKAIPRMGYIALLMFIIFYIYGAVGSIFFHEINPVLWGDIAISMLTLFRVATFEDWTDVMYETMAVHPLSWIYYLSFIFLTAFVFLNMMIGTILEVMTEESNAASQQQAHDERQSMADALVRIEAKLEQLESRLERGDPGDRTD